MMTDAVSIKKIQFTIVVLLLSCPLFAQITESDTADYVPEYYHDALDYNLNIAASKGLYTEVERLILRGAEVDAETDEGVTPLIYAVTNKKLKAVNMLLSYSADPNKKTSNGETPLILILKEFISLEELVYSAVTASLESNCLEIAESLIRYGADIDFQDYHGAAALHYASIYGSFRFTDLLLYYRADIDRKAFDGTTPLMAAVWAGHANVADLLVQNGANMEARDDEGFTPLLIAAQNGDTLLLNYFRTKGVDIYETEPNRWDALSLAIKYDHREAAELLIKAGDKFKDPGRKALNYYNVAAKYGRKELFETLEENNFSDRYKPQINQVELSISSKFNIQDIYSGMTFLFREPRKKIGFVTGFDTKLWYTKVLVKESDLLYYQYMDKSSIVYGGIFKEILLKNNPFKSDLILTGSLSCGYFFGNKFKGTETSPDSKFRIMPAVSLKLVKKDFAVYAGLEFMNTDFYKTWPVWCRAGLSYNFDLKQSRAPIKTIKWY
ncbi:MAG: ankyrin repeat domain-containing protein [Bacteroidales bacterium]|nr:ankyrin repeat domain-containing protein [Bacteroidales bacterium]